jgi:hypothetical protein
MLKLLIESYLRLQVISRKENNTLIAIETDSTRANLRDEISKQTDVESLHVQEFIEMQACKIKNGENFDEILNETQNILIADIIAHNDIFFCQTCKN